MATTLVVTTVVAISRRVGELQHLLQDHLKPFIKMVGLFIGVLNVVVGPVPMAQLVTLAVPTPPPTIMTRIVPISSVSILAHGVLSLIPLHLSLPICSLCSALLF